MVWVLHIVAWGMMYAPVIEAGLILAAAESVLLAVVMFFVLLLRRFLARSASLPNP